ncbi:MAG: carbon starvation protein A [Clostridiales bacterium]|nr:carbon starvation protein A [Clostridiales bacterium]
MILIIVLGCAIFLTVGYLTYGKFLAQRVFELSDKNPVPSHEMEDGVDYVPAKKGMLLGQHFSAIAAAGPINGPVQAAILFGWVPALIWVLLGSVFIGGVHDMGSLIASVRHKATSISEVVRQHVSHRAWILFMLFIWICLVYVIVAFTDTTASSFVGLVTLENGDTVAGAAIASSSIMYLILPIIMGLLMRFAKLKEGLAVAIFLPLVGVAIWAGKYIPFSIPVANEAMEQKVWCVIILAYCLIAAMLPMWLLLQPRGALGGYFLYIALFVAAIGVVFGGYEINYPAFIPMMADGNMQNNMFPILFITIACGACSGFHALVSSGTSSKQLNKESDAKSVGYGSMLLEGMVAVISIVCVMILAQDSEMITKAPNFIYASGIGSFMELIGIPAVFGVSFGLMAFTTFVYDTLDVCTRLGRYIIQELTGWKDKKGIVIGTALTAGVPVFFIFQTSGDVPAWKIFWNLFGASNQLLAALALVGVTIWLYHSKKGVKLCMVTLIPAVFMFIMSNWALVIMIFEGWVLKKGNPAVPFVSFILLVLAFWVAIETIISVIKDKKAEDEDIAVTPA